MFYTFNLALIRVGGYLADAPASSQPNIDNKLDTLIKDLTAWSLIACTIAIIIAAVIWAWGSQSQNAAQATQGKKGVLVAIAAAAVIVGAQALVNWGQSFGTGL